MSGTVYLIAQPTIARNGSLPDLRPLAKHGEVRVLVQSGEYPGFNPQKCFELIRDRLSDFNPKTDHIAWAGGDTLAAVLTGVVLGDMGLEEIPWLRYERGRDSKNPKIRTDAGAEYVPIMVRIPSSYVDPDQSDLFRKGDGNEPVARRA